MLDDEAYATLRANAGKQVDIVLGGQRISVVVLSVDADGALLRPTDSDPHQSGSEFWVAFDHIDMIERHPAAN
jgi:hypothetical protein